MPDSPFSYANTAQSVHASLDEAFKAIPDGKRGALLMTANTHGGSAMLAARINGTWQIAAGGTWSQSEKPQGQIAVLGTW
jgi:hypothetical protein